ncbi:MAG: sodium-dependent bicarbonate transport family permease [Candidatus Methylacidiphilales bacterium]
MASLGAFENVIQPPVLFFFLGVLAAVCRSGLEISQTVAKFLAQFLLLAIGFHGGVELAKAGFSAEALSVMLLAVAFAAIQPLYLFGIAKRFFSVANAAAIAATFGSVSAVTFVVGTEFLALHDVPINGYMVATLALMESPAILVGLVLARRHMAGGNVTIRWPTVLTESFLHGPVFLLLGSFLIGYLTGPIRAVPFDPLFKDLFKGVICLFLLDMGLNCARQFQLIEGARLKMIFLGVLFPVINALVALLVVRVFGLPPSDAFLMLVLASSGSYIAVPAVFRLALPEANAVIYTGLALGVTFPFNILVGLPLYWWLIQIAL